MKGMAETVVEAARMVRMNLTCIVRRGLDLRVE
jgi:hypothetical protein